MTNQLIGQQHILEPFKEFNRKGLLGHAYALTGPAGIGKKTLAKTLAGLLLCYDTPDKAPCGICNACTTFAADTNPNFTRVAAKTQKILIEQIRVLIDDIGVKPPLGRKVYVIEEADKMTPQAQNCLLKTLEEPPSYAVIILTVTNYESLLMTVRSRLVQLKLSRYTDAEMRQILALKGIKGQEVESIISYSEGIAGRAVNLARQEGFQALRELVLRFYETQGNHKGEDLELNQYLSKDKEIFSDCLGILESLLRDALFVKSGKTDGLINHDKRDNIIRYAHKHTLQDIMARMSLINEIRGHLRNNMNYQLAVDMITLS